MILFPQAKINLGLNVLHKRDDGYHEMETCMKSIPLSDVIEILESNTFQFVQTGISIPDSQEHNLCVRAYKLLKEDFDLPPVFIHLRKQIPMGAGLGGGSSDGSSVLMGLNKLFELGISDADLESYAAKLGSDCPFFIRNNSQLASGRGEILEPLELDLSDYYLKLIYPGIHIGTQEAYSRVHLNNDQKRIKDILSLPIEDWKNELQNSFEKGEFETFPVLSKIKDDLYREGAVYASLSGSGSAIYGIFREEPKETYSDQKGFLEFIKKFNS